MASRFSMGLAGLLGLLAVANCGSSGKVDYTYSFSETGVCAKMTLWPSWPTGV